MLSKLSSPVIPDKGAQPMMYTADIMRQITDNVRNLTEQPM